MSSLTGEFLVTKLFILLFYYHSNDTYFHLFLNSDNITFPICLEGREINMIPQICNKASPFTYGEEKSDILEKFHLFLISLILLLVLRLVKLKNLISI